MFKVSSHSLKSQNVCIFYIINANQKLLQLYTVTSRDMIFRYPDWVRLTHFVHRAKKVFGMWA
jgi:hypothetical protein